MIGYEIQLWYLVRNKFQSKTKSENIFLTINNFLSKKLFFQHNFFPTNFFSKNSFTVTRGDLEMNDINNKGMLKLEKNKM